MRFDIDSEFLRHFQNLKQVFLYLTDECNLRCIHCLYKPDLDFHLKGKDIKLGTALALISDFREMGACKLSLIGGEPTLYGASEGHRPLLRLIREAKEELGYEYVRIATNGMFENNLLREPDFRRLDEISFSLDGFTIEMNDPIRGKGTFERCLSNAQRAVAQGYKVDITCCMHRGLLEKNEDGNAQLHSMIVFAESIGASRINFHDLFKMGVPIDAWTGNLHPLMSIEEWLSIYAAIRKNIETGRYGISVRFPQCFVARTEFEKNPEYYGYCPVKMGERVLVHPNGMIRVCSNMIGTAYGVAKFCNGRILWDKSTTNEVGDHANELTPCTNRNKSRDFGDFVALCFSFKPNQDEIIWREKLGWETKKKDSIRGGCERASSSKRCSLGKMRS
jgi:MoaA/NifB/PqqE/SkfB family radical SAM enzyme